MCVVKKEVTIQVMALMWKRCEPFICNEMKRQSTEIPRSRCGLAAIRGCDLHFSDTQPKRTQQLAEFPFVPRLLCGAYIAAAAYQIL